MQLNPGTHLGTYEIVGPLGAGGMGEVYRAKDLRLGREVALKVLPQHLSANPRVRARFEREAKTVSSLNHPNICTLFDVGREGSIMGSQPALISQVAPLSPPGGLPVTRTDGGLYPTSQPRCNRSGGGPGGTDERACRVDDGGASVQCRADGHTVELTRR